MKWRINWNQMRWLEFKETMRWTGEAVRSIQDVNVFACHCAEQLCQLTKLQKARNCEIEEESSKTNRCGASSVDKVVNLQIKMSRTLVVGAKFASMLVRMEEEPVFGCESGDHGDYEEMLIYSMAVRETVHFGKLDCHDI